MKSWPASLNPVYPGLDLRARSVGTDWRSGRATSEYEIEEGAGIELPSRRPRGGLSERIAADGMVVRARMASMRTRR
jgi:hypothetical protein